MKMALNKYSNKNRRKKNMKEKIIYSKRIATELRKRGCRFLRLGVNENFPQFNTYIFQQDEKLERALQELTNKQ